MRCLTLPRARSVLCLVSIALGACGGGSGDTPATAPPLPTVQTVTGVTLGPLPAAFTTEGDTATLAASVATSDGKPYGGSVAWASSDSTVATVANGFVTALKSGTVSITASAGGKTSAPVGRTLLADTVVVLTISAPDTLFGAHPVGVSLAAKNGHGRAIPLPTDARLVSSNSSIAAVATDALGTSATGVSSGQTAFRATATRAQPVTRAVTVVMPPVNIRLVFAGDYPASLRGVAGRAAVRWERMFASALPTGAQMMVRAGECGRSSDTTFAPNSTIEVRFTIGNAFGGVAVGGPCALRAAPSPRLAVIGAVTLSTDWVSFYTRATTDTNALLNAYSHEIGHVLGLGTLPSVPFQSGVPGDNPRFTGPTARAQYAALGGKDTVGGVPYEGDGQYSHWKRVSVPNEIMNLNVAGSVVVPISRISVGALIDLGYPMSLGTAERYAIP